MGYEKKLVFKFGTVIETENILIYYNGCFTDVLVLYDTHAYSNAIVLEQWNPIV